jgi:hypothetical protein
VTADFGKTAIELFLSLTWSFPNGERSLNNWEFLASIRDYRDVASWVLWVRNALSRQQLVRENILRGSLNREM